MLRTLLPAMLLALPLSALAETPNLEPGEWEFTSTATAEGDFPVPDQTGTETECLTAEMIDDIHSGDLEQEQGCEFLEREASPDAMRYVMSCQTGEGDVMIIGEMRYLQDRYEGNMRVHTETPIGEMIMNTDIEGRRLGDC